MMSEPHRLRDSLTPLPGRVLDTSPPSESFCRTDLERKTRTGVAWFSVQDEGREGIFWSNLVSSLSRSTAVPYAIRTAAQ